MSPVRRTLRWRLVALGVLVPLVAIAAVLIWEDYRVRRDYLVSLLEIRSQQVNQQLEDFVGATESVAQLSARGFARAYPGAATTSAPPAGTRVAPNPYLADVLDAAPSRYVNASVISASGRLLASSAAFTAGTAAPEAAFAARLRGATSFVVSDVFAPPGSTGPPSVLFAYPVGGTGSGSDPPAAYLVLRSTLSSVSSALTMSAGFPASARSGILDATGRLLATTAAEPGGTAAAVGADVSQTAIWAQARSHPTTPWYGPGLDGVQRVVFFEYPRGTPWVTTVAYAQSDLFGPLWSRVIILSVGLVISVIATLALASVADHRQRTALTTAMAQREARSRRAITREAQHHVRNALQVLRLRSSAESDPDVQFYVDDAIERIEWVLREVLPGENEGPQTPPGPLARQEQKAPPPDTTAPPPVADAPPGEPE